MKTTLPEDFIKELIKKIKQEKPNKKQLNKIKIELCSRYNLKEIPKNVELMLNIPVPELERIKKYFIIKEVRTGSGVAVIALMSKPFKCPHGKCIMCPGGPESYFGDVPQSYTGKEPATRRAIRNNYDPYFQIFNRLEHYVVMGQNPQKVEMIIMGGTFPSFNKDYKKEFIRNCFKAMNDFSDLFYDYKGNLQINKFKKFFELPGKVGSRERVKKIHKKLLKKKNENIISLKEEQKRNEKSNIRDVALCIETRPDYCKEEHINEMLEFGVTRVELGVQSTKDSILNKMQRGHTVKDSIKATELMKDSFLKITYHMMPGFIKGFSNGSLQDELKDLLEIIKNPDFRPDALKIYPALVIKGTELYELWKKGKFNPVNTEEAIELIREFKQSIPKYMRIMRVQRDIPVQRVEAGVKKTNLRQIIRKKMKKENLECNCIRCREPFLSEKYRDIKIDFDNVKILTEEYYASKGKEIFISAEDTKNNILIGFCRLRIPNKTFRKELNDKKTAGIRELHVYGTALGLQKRKEESIQHKGYGKILLKKAEEIAKNRYNIKKLYIISGVGVREYYKRLGYKKQGVYMAREL